MGEGDIFRSARLGVRLCLLVHVEKEPMKKSALYTGRAATFAYSCESHSYAMNATVVG